MQDRVKKKNKKPSVAMATTPPHQKYTPINLEDLTEDAFETLMAQLKLHWVGSPSCWDDYYEARSNEFARIAFFNSADFDIPLDRESE